MSNIYEVATALKEIGASIEKFGNLAGVELEGWLDRPIRRATNDMPGLLLGAVIVWTYVVKVMTYSKQEVYSREEVLALMDNLDSGSIFPAGVLRAIGDLLLGHVTPEDE